MSSSELQGAPEARVRLTRERVLRAAIGVADEHGAGAVTMRAVATQLGVEAMSLYNHVKNKDAILDGMVDIVVDEIELPADAGDWREAMRRRAISAQRVFARHPWAPPLMDSRTTSGPARLRYFDWVLGVLVDAGFSLDVAIRCFSVLDSYIYGFGRQQLSTTAGEAPPQEKAEEMLSAVPAADFPHLHRMVLRAMDVGYDAEADFAFGLDIILGGLAQVLSSQRNA
ncbi:TetR/AcrR family transcriptional regulator [Pengzhenrongella frigida]|uniref:TetR/AcrR family transcriptional regulator n=1 Tax=Pengzhenrongella frigida TaxID=1259133 RepID=A0A4Q5N3Q3_9MICO|nr:TetR/AcrR family transcriptional regulator [Cellulomonas sp. HLT2-17]RYV52830.1 TetR/AcrR family transcriptional regulator [Cellulomonas sp. HLT2-17]